MDTTHHTDPFEKMLDRAEDKLNVVREILESLQADKGQCRRQAVGWPQTCLKKHPDTPDWCERCRVDMALYVIEVGVQ